MHILGACLELVGADSNVCPWSPAFLEPRLSLELVGVLVPIPMHVLGAALNACPWSRTWSRKLGYNENLLLKGVQVERFNQVWVGDITYILLQNKFAYLAMLMDLFFRKIIGWSLDLKMEAPLVIKALRQAIKQRQPLPGLIHHTDRGGQYAAKEYRQILDRTRMKQSMSRAADCYDNAFMESCFGTIETELEMTAYQSFNQALGEIQEYINYFNTIRRHSSIDCHSPNRFERIHNPKGIARPPSMDHRT